MLIDGISVSKPKTPSFLLLFVSCYRFAKFYTYTYFVYTVNFQNTTNSFALKMNLLDILSFANNSNKLVHAIF